MFRHCWLSQLGFRVGRATGNQRLETGVTVTHTDCMHAHDNPTPQSEADPRGKITAAEKPLNDGPLQPVQHKQHPRLPSCSRQRIILRDRSGSAWPCRWPSQPFPAHSTPQKGQLPRAALHRAAEAARTGLAALPHRPREVTPEPSPVDLRGQPSSCRGGAAQIVMLENGRSIAQTQHWHLCSTDYIISPWHLPVVIQDFRP